MSTQDYDEVEKLFAGTWKCDRDENLDEFMTAAELPEDTKAMSKKELVVTITREGDSLKEKTVIDGVSYEVTMKINETFEWKDKEENPVYHVKVHENHAFSDHFVQGDWAEKTTPSFKDGVFTYDVTPQRENGGKRHIYNMSVQGDELVADLSLPDGPSVTAKRFYKKC